MQGHSGTTLGNERRMPLEPTDNKLKRKRDDTDKPSFDSKLQEYLKVMEAPSKSKTWANEDNMQTETTSIAQHETATPEKDDRPSDAEYQEGFTHPKKRRADVEPRALQSPTQAHESDVHPLEEPTPSEMQRPPESEQAASGTAREGEKES